MLKSDCISLIPNNTSHTAPCHLFPAVGDTLQVSIQSLCIKDFWWKFLPEKAVVYTSIVDKTPTGCPVGVIEPCSPSQLVDGVVII